MSESRYLVTKLSLHYTLCVIMQITLFAYNSKNYNVMKCYIQAWLSSINFR